MTRTTIIIGAFVLLACGTATGMIHKSKHDIIYYFGHEINVQGEDSEACTFCHHPHHMGLEEEKWDLSTLGEPPEQGFEVYISEEGDSMLLCASCHDGVVCSDIFSQGRRSDDHPVGFDYVKLSYKSKKFPYYSFNLGGVRGMVSGEIYPLKDLKMDCNTCHDPHEGEARFVRGGRKALRGSVICVDCHSCISDSCR